MNGSSFFEKLTDVCHDLLYHDRKTFGYLNDHRGLSASMISKYKIGAFPKDLRILFDRLSVDELVENGIIWNAYESPFKYSQNKIHYPVVIPISNTQGKAIAIGCRTLMSDKEREKYKVPKYKNSEYKKGAYLFGMDKAIRTIREHDKVFVVEGYFDVLSCHQAGITNVVASCGTAFTQRQLSTLSRYTENIVLLFDNDNPGRLSSKKAMQRFDDDSLISANLTCRFTPDGYKDIDEYLCRGGDLNFFIG